MRLYLVSRTDHVDWDEHDAVVFASMSAEDARKGVLGRSDDNHANVPVEDWLCGFTADNIVVDEIAARTTHPAGVVLASFNAG